MTEGRFREQRAPLSSEMLGIQLSGLSSFGKDSLRRGYLMMATSGTSAFRVQSKGKQMTAIDAAYGFLQRKNTTNFESGFSAAQIAKGTNYSRSIISSAVQELVNRGQVKMEQKGKGIKYYLPTQEAHSPSPEPPQE